MNPANPNPGNTIKLVPKGKFPGRRKINEIITKVCGLLNMQVVQVDSQDARAVVTDRSTILQIPRSAPAATSPPSGGGATRYRVITNYDDYLACKTWDGSTLGASTVNIAKPPELRHSITSAGIEGVTIGYGYAVRTYNLDGQRTASASGYTSQVEIVLPVFQAGTGPESEIWADEPVGGPGIIYANDGTTPLSPNPTWMDTNRAGRAWCQVG